MVEGEGGVCGAGWTAGGLFSLGERGGGGGAWAWQQQDVAGLDAAGNEQPEEEGCAFVVQSRRKGRWLQLHAAVQLWVMGWNCLMMGCGGDAAVAALVVEGRCMGRTQPGPSLRP